MSLEAKIAKNTILQLTGKVISTLLGTAAIIFMMRALGAEKFGWYVTASSFLQFIGIISDFGFTLTTTNLLSEKKFDQKKILNTVFTWRLLTAFIFQALAPLIFLLFAYPKEITTAVAITTISFFSLALNQIFIGYFQSTLKNYLHMVGEVLGRSVLLIGIVIVYSTNKNFLAIMWVITISSVLYTVYLYYKSPPIRLEFDPIISREFYKKTWPVGLSIIFNALYLQGDRVLLPFFVSQTDVGLYGAAYKLLDFIIQSAALLMGIMLPLLTASYAQKKILEFKNHFQNSFILTALFLFPTVIGAIILSDPLMHVIAGENFVGAGMLLRFLSVAIVGICFGMIGGHTLLSLNRQKFSLYIFASNAFFSCIGYILLIPRYGVGGAVTVTIFSEFYSGILLTYFAARFSNNSLPWFQLFKIFIASLLMGVILFFLKPLNLSIFISLFLGLFLYGIGIILLKVISLAKIKDIIFKKPIPINFNI